MRHKDQIKRVQSGHTDGDEALLMRLNERIPCFKRSCLITYIYFWQGCSLLKLKGQGQSNEAFYLG